MDYKSLLNYLLETRDAKYASFSKTLSNSDYSVIGTRIPILRKLVKDHIKDEELEPNDFELNKYLEMDFMYFGLSLSRVKTIDDQLLFLSHNIHLAKSWAITDTISTYLKKMDFEEYYSFFLKNQNTKEIYQRRFCFILGLKFYKNKEILKVLKYIKENEDYMIMMAQAWLLATVAICFENEIYDFLKNFNDKTLIRKTISKMVESYRINDEAKERFKKFRDSL